MTEGLTQKSEFLYLNQEDVRRTGIDIKSAMEAIEKALVDHSAKNFIMPPKTALSLEDRYKGTFFILPAYIKDFNILGVKMGGAYLNNRKRGLPSLIHWAFIIDPETGGPIAMMDSSFLTPLRTGAVAGVAAKFLGKKKENIVAIIGAGYVAEQQLRAVSLSLPIKEVRVNDIRPEARKYFVDTLGPELNLPVREALTYQECVHNADLIITAPMIKKPEVTVKPEWLKQGYTIITTAYFCEIEPSFPKIVDKFIVDDWEQCKAGGSFTPWIKDGTITAKDIYAELSEIVAEKKPGREKEFENILLWSRGIAMEDLLLENIVLEKARKAGIGKRIRLFDHN